MTNKEFGSDFHWLATGKFRDLSYDNEFLNEVDQLYFSGRGALYDILKNGIKLYQWKTLFVPSYYCLEVYEFLKNLPIEIKYYDFNPIDKQGDFVIPDEISNVILVVDYFGIVKPNISNFNRAKVIEDLTHDLSKIQTSEADFVFGSLRKILPLPVGGFVKSNSNLILSDHSSDYAEYISMKKFSAMFLKAEYLEGKFQDKDTFRKLFIDAEEGFEDVNTYANLPVNVLEYLRTIKVDAIIKQKRDNLQLLKSILIPSQLYKLFTHESNTDLACIFHFQSNETRNQLRTYLIEHKIYPMILWPNQLTKRNKEVENLLLFVHIDYRYTSDDIKYIATIINEFSKSNEL